MRNMLILIALVGLLLVVALPWEETYLIRGGRERALDEAVEELASPRFKARERALRRLVSLGESSRSRLETASESEDAEVRHRARMALATLNRSAKPAAERREVQFTRIIQWGLTEPGGLRPGGERFAVLGVDPECAAKTAVTVAEEVEREALLHQRAVRLIVDLGLPAGGPYLASIIERGYFLPSTLHQAANGLEKFGTREVFPVLLRALSGEDPFARKYALRTLGRVGGSEDFQSIRIAMSDPDHGVRTEAPAALSRLGGPGAISDLVFLATDSEPTVRSEALAALARLPGPKAAEVARRAVKDPEEVVRTRALRVLGETGNKADRLSVLARIHDENAIVRSEAVRALAKLGFAKDAVRLGVRDTSSVVRRVALIMARDLPIAVRKAALANAPEEKDPFLRLFRDALIDGTVAD